VVGSNWGPEAHHLRGLTQLFALGLDRTEQVLPRFIEGLGALRFQVGRQLIKRYALSDVGDRFREDRMRVALFGSTRLSAKASVCSSEDRDELISEGISRLWSVFGLVGP